MHSLSNCEWQSDETGAKQRATWPAVIASHSCKGATVGRHTKRTERKKSDFGQNVEFGSSDYKIDFTIWPAEHKVEGSREHYAKYSK